MTGSAVICLTQLLQLKSHLTLNGQQSKATTDRAFIQLFLLSKIRLYLANGLTWLTLGDGLMFCLKTPLQHQPMFSPCPFPPVCRCTVDVRHYLQLFDMIWITDIFPDPPSADFKVKLRSPSQYVSWNVMSNYLNLAHSISRTALFKLKFMFSMGWLEFKFSVLLSLCTAGPLTVLFFCTFYTQKPKPFLIKEYIMSF